MTLLDHDLWGMFPTPCYIYGTKNQGSSECVYFAPTMEAPLFCFLCPSILPPQAAVCLIPNLYLSVHYCKHTMYCSYLSILIWSDTGADIVQWLMKNLSIEDPGMFLKWESRVYSAEWILNATTSHDSRAAGFIYKKNAHYIIRNTGVCLSLW